jgi:ATP-dependent RNA helicase SUPV3L1/SUV3
VQKQVTTRLATWFEAQKQKHLLPLVKMSESAADPAVPAVVRAVFAQLADAGGVAPRLDLDSALGHLDKDQRHLLRRAGIDIGVLDLYHPGLLKPGAARWRAALQAARIGKPCLPLPQPGLTLIPTGDKPQEMGARIAGFRSFGPQMLRIDMAERMARTAHETIAKNEPFSALSPQIVSLGLSEEAFLQLMRAAGFRPIDPVPTPAPVAEMPAEAAPAVEGTDVAEATDAAPEAAAEAVTEAPVEAAAEVATETPAEAPVAATGANWVFKGRQKGRPQGDRGPRAPRRDQQQRPEGKFAGKSDNRGEGRGDNRGGKGGDRGPHKGGDRDDNRAPRATPASHKAATSNHAFAGLAELLGRNG